VLQCVAVWCSVLQCHPTAKDASGYSFGVCCSVLQCVAVCYSVLQCGAVRCSVTLQLRTSADMALVCVAVHRSVLQCVAVWCSVLQCQPTAKNICGYGFGVCCSVLQCVAVCCSLLQCLFLAQKVCDAIIHTHLTHSNTEQRAATHCNNIHAINTTYIFNATRLQYIVCCNVLPRVAVFCNTLQHTATHNATLHTPQPQPSHVTCCAPRITCGMSTTESYDILNKKNTATHCNTLQNTAAYCNT